MIYGKTLENFKHLYRFCFLLCMCAQSCPILCNSMNCSPCRLLCPWNFPGKNTGAGCYFLLQGTFLTQGLNPCLLCLLHWQVGCLLAEPLGCCAVLSRVRLFGTPFTVAHQAPLSMGILQARMLEWVAMPPSGDIPNPGIKPRSLTLQAYSLLYEPPGKPKNTGVGSLSLLQGNFPTQGLKWDLLHCRQILYQLSYPGSPRLLFSNLK